MVGKHSGYATLKIVYSDVLAFDYGIITGNDTAPDSNRTNRAGQTYLQCAVITVAARWSTAFACVDVGCGGRHFRRPTLSMVV